MGALVEDCAGCSIGELHAMDHLGHCNDNKWDICCQIVWAAFFWI